MARQPEKAPQIQTAMIIIGALLEGATFFGLIICIILAGKATF
jgi:F-type H+-transporting ATPase subunit c